MNESAVEQAREWAKLEGERIELDAEERDLRNRLGKNTRAQNAVAKALGERVGKNIPKRLYRISESEFLLVDYQHGIHLMKAEEQ